MSRNRQWLIGSWTALALGGLIIAIAVRGAGPLPGDLGLALLVQEAVPVGGIGGSLLGHAESAVWGLLLLAILGALLLRQWGAALLILLGSLSGLLLAEGLLKPLVARPRPSPELVRVAAPPDSYGFPSSTTLLVVVLCGIVTYLVWRHASRPAAGRGARRGVALALVTSLLLIIVTGLARVSVGEHWPSDIVGSWFAGGAWLLLLVGVRSLR
jgi:membrane-associated phospholipid phosphatase